MADKRVLRTKMVFKDYMVGRFPRSKVMRRGMSKGEGVEEEKEDNEYKSQ